MQPWVSPDGIKFFFRIELVMLSPPAPDERGPFLDYDFSESYSYHINYTAEVARCASGYARPKPDIYWRTIDAFGNEISKIYPTRGHFSFNPEMIDYEDDYFYTGAEFSLNIEEGFQVKIVNSRTRFSNGNPLILFPNIYSSFM